MKLIVGLGNPGARYRDTLHNAGFSAVDALADELRVGSWNRRFKGLVAQGRYQQNPYLLLKPQTYMNVSGESVLACKQFFKLELEDILVVSDDVDRPAGSLRYRATGGHGGHNGLRDIIRLCGANRFHRLKIGIGRPDFQEDVANYVLRKPADETLRLVEDAVQQAVGYQLDFIQDTPIQIHSKKPELSP